MLTIVDQLEETLRSLDPQSAKHLEDLVRDALALAVQARKQNGVARGWPPGYFERLAGSFAGEELERLSQGELPTRDVW